jgi:hypothetical protein
VTGAGPRLKRRWTAGLPGLLLLGLAGAPLLHAPPPARGSGEPLALALAPLGPVRALVSSALWVGLLRTQSDVDSDRVTAIARALLEVHPDLEVVRVYLANQLVVTEARRAPDRARHDALVEAGLQLMDEGLQRRDSPRLRSALAWTLATQARIDVRFAAVAARHFGVTAEDEAIELLRDTRDPGDARVRGQLLVERGLSSLTARDDERAARRDLEEAERALAPVAAEPDGPFEVEELLQPLRSALARVKDRPAIPLPGEDSHP